MMMMMMMMIMMTTSIPVRLAFNTEVANFFSTCALSSRPT